MFVKLTELTKAAAKGLGDSLGDDIDREIIADEIKQGISELWEISEGKAYCVTRIEEHELVIVCFGGKGLIDAAPTIFEAAKAHNLSIRFHTNRPALARLLKNYKPRYIQHVYRIDTNG